LHSFFSCVGKATKSNQHVSGISSYFKHEPTRNEVIDCYNSNILHQGTDQGTNKKADHGIDQSIKNGGK
ncbi:MAG TPA: hypothetical protein VGC75_00510, partial [Candidatus Nitrosocosmicus sp.]